MDSGEKLMTSVIMEDSIISNDHVDHSIQGYIEILKPASVVERDKGDRMQDSMIPSMARSVACLILSIKNFEDLN